MKRLSVFAASIITVFVLTCDLAYSQSLPPLPPLPPLAPIDPTVPVMKDNPNPVGNNDSDQGKQHMFSERRSNANGTYVDDTQNLKYLQGGDHLKIMNDLNSNEQHSCMVVGDILDCNG